MGYFKNLFFVLMFKEYFKIIVMTRKVLLSTLIILITFCYAQAQYAVNKKQYNYKEYRYQPTDRIDPFVAGFISYFIPGLGQMASGETLRGTAFLVGHVGVTVTGFVGLVNGLTSLDGSDKFPYNTGYSIAYACAVLQQVISVWSAIDASRVAKVNNMALRQSAQRAEWNYNVEPFVFNKTENGTLGAGLTLRVSF